MLAPEIIDDINRIYTDLMALDSDDYGRWATDNTLDKANIGRRREIEISVVDLEQRWADEYLVRLKHHLMGIRKFKKILSIVFTSIFLVCAALTFCVLYFKWNLDYELFLYTIVIGIFAGIASLPFNIQIIVRLSHRPKAKRMYRAEESMVMDYVSRVKRIKELCDKYNIPLKMRTTEWIKELNNQIVIYQKTGVSLSEIVAKVYDKIPKPKKTSGIQESVNEYIRTNSTYQFMLTLNYGSLISYYCNYRENPWTNDTARRENKQRRKEQVWKHLQRWAASSNAASGQFSSSYDAMPSVSRGDDSSDYDFLFGDGGGATIKSGNAYLDYKGNYCDADSYFVDAKGYICSKESGFYDYDHNYVRPGEPYRDPSGRMVYPTKR